MRAFVKLPIACNREDYDCMEMEELTVSDITINLECRRLVIV